MTEEEKTEKKEKEVIWEQPRVPNIKKGHNPNYPYYMMGIFAVLVILSALFAFATG